jgi:HAD superfamily hydrolase (TIGR01509 family)
LIRGLIFDFDGLILDTEVPEFEAWQRIFHSHGAELAHEKWASIVGTSSNGFNVISDLEQQIGRKVDEAKIRSIHASDSLSEIEKKTPQPGILDYLERGRNSGYKIGLASSSGKQWIDKHLSRLNIRKYFDSVCTADDVLNVKPWPDLYFLAMDKLGLNPSESIAFEDSPNGITAAKSAGMTCVAIPNDFTRHLDLSKADIIINSLEELGLAELVKQVEKNDL